MLNKQTPDTVSIITLPPERWREFRALRLQALKEEPQAFGSSHEGNLAYPDQYWIDRLINVEKGMGDILFAEDNGTLVGLMGNYFPQETPDTAVVVMVFVQPEKRGEGIAGVLLETLLNRLRDRPEIERAALTVNVEQKAAVALYTRFGFTIIRTTPDMMGDGNIYDEYIMEKSLRNNAP
ncbi:MAG: GCN5-related N-acetyltransferase [Chlorobi bacterium]|jgi:ribosomal protein S18 acetylase RimI-like enzyme|nr:GCN5-related N-acetyltransferase [Chlorobiota bacterium]